jgi:hypothetical protein
VPGRISGPAVAQLRVLCAESPPCRDQNLLVTGSMQPWLFLAGFSCAGAPDRQDPKSRTEQFDCLVTSRCGTRMSACPSLWQVFVLVLLLLACRCVRQTWSSRRWRATTAAYSAMGRQVGVATVGFVVVVCQGWAGSPRQ